MQDSGSKRCELHTTEKQGNPGTALLEYNLALQVEPAPFRLYPPVPNDARVKDDNHDRPGENNRKYEVLGTSDIVVGYHHVHGEQT